MAEIILTMKIQLCSQLPSAYLRKHAKHCVKLAFRQMKEIAIGSCREQEERNPDAHQRQRRAFSLCKKKVDELAEKSGMSERDLNLYKTILNVEVSYAMCSKMNTSPLTPGPTEAEKLPFSLPSNRPPPPSPPL